MAADESFSRGQREASKEKRNIMPVYRVDESKPRIDPSVYLAPSAAVIGDVTIGRGSSVWFHCVVRADADAIVIGEETNIQDLTMCHEDPGKPLRIGHRVTIGHRCIVHGCVIEDDCLIGMGAIVMNGAVVGRGSIVAAGSVILENTVVPPGSLVAGVPAKPKRALDDSALEAIRLPGRIYAERSKLYGSRDRFAEIQ